MDDSLLSRPGEIWKRVDLPYVVEDVEVSSFGRVRKLGKTYVISNSRCHRPFIVRRPTRLCRQIIRVGYPSVSLRSPKGDRPYIPVHALVCSAFIGPQPSSRHEVAHWDGDPLNPGPFNLRWVTPLENAADRERHGRTVKGEAVYGAKLNDAVVRHIRDLKQSGRYPGSKVLAKKYGVGPGTINHAVMGHTWKHLL